jgi:hypothetical protein
MDENSLDQGFDAGLGVISFQYRSVLEMLRKS